MSAPVLLNLLRDEKGMRSRKGPVILPKALVLTGEGEHEKSDGETSIS